MQLLVLGVDRSGTSRLVRLLALAGAHEPAADRVDDVRRACDELLHEGVHGRPTDGEAASSGAAGQELVDRVRQIVLELDGHGPWVLEEPRLALLWSRLAPVFEAPVAVHVCADPQEVAERRTATTLAATRCPTVTVDPVHLDADPVSATAGLVAALQELGVPGLRVPAADEITALVPPAIAGPRSDAAQLERITAEVGASLDQALQALQPLKRSRALKVARRLRMPGASRGRRPGAHPIDVAIARTTAHVKDARRQIEELRSLEESPWAGTEGPPPPADVLRARRQALRSQGGRIKVAVLVWDVGHNPFGRAHLLADMLSDRYDVELWGAQFDRYGSAVWAPMRSTHIPVTRFRGTEFPDFLETLERAAGHIDADVLYASKARLPSVALGALAKARWNRHLMIDVDDFEPSFFDVEEGVDPRRLLHSDDPDLALPFGRLWTRACDVAVRGADALTTSNVELQARYGGAIVPHARDESTFDPARFDREAVRRRLGIGEDDRLILFGGTPRKHKGIIEVLDAVAELGDERVRVGAFASRELDEVMKRAGQQARWLVPLAAPSFAELPAMLAAADLTCALQATDHPVSRFQMPAKVTDALAMEVPCLVTPVPPLQPLIDRDVLLVNDGSEPLAERLRGFFADPDAARERSRRGREVFLEEYSYGAVRPVLRKLVEGGVDDPAPPDPRLGSLVSTLRSRYPADGAHRPPAPRRPVPAGSTYDLVVFWKQNDTGIYGRRQDLFVQHLEASGRFGTIVHFDNPISLEALLVKARKGLRSRDETRLVVVQTVRRIARRADRGRLRQRTFVFGRDKRTQRAGLPRKRDFVDYVRTVLAAEGIGERPVVFWTYPRIDALPELIDELAPDLVVTDVVDDYRSWHEPGSPRWTEADRNYREVLSRSDIVLANCEPVARSMREFTEHVHVIPNACDLDIVGPRGPRPAELRDLSGPIIGYAGNLSARIDFRLFQDLVHQHPAWNFVVIGSTHRDRSILEITDRPNVRFVGATPYGKTVELIRHCDVAIIPHLDNEISRSMNPLKAYVYAAAGVPIVATPVDNLDELADFITIAEGTEEFGAAIQAALERGRPDTSRATLEPLGWDVRVRDALRLVDEELDRIRRDGRGELEALG